MRASLSVSLLDQSDKFLYPSDNVTPPLFFSLSLSLSLSFPPCCMLGYQNMQAGANYPQHSMAMMQQPGSYPAGGRWVRKDTVINVIYGIE